MTAAQINARAIMKALKTDNPTLAQIETALRMIRDGDLVHVDLIPEWISRQDAEYRGDLLSDLQDRAAEEQHEQRQRDGFPSSAQYLETCIRAAGRGHLLKGGA
jgi:hypothetical protein